MHSLWNRDECENQYRWFSTIKMLDIVITPLSIPASLSPLSLLLSFSPSLFPPLSPNRQFLLLWSALKSFQLQCWKLKKDRYKQFVAMMLVLWTFSLAKNICPTHDPIEHLFLKYIGWERTTPLRHISKIYSSLNSSA